MATSLMRATEAEGVIKREGRRCRHSECGHGKGEQQMAAARHAQLTHETGSGCLLQVTRIRAFIDFLVERIDQGPISSSDAAP